MKPGDFRHDDHKFEWTREEFEDWCNNICTRFPDYVVQFHGVGKPPQGYESIGCCSQLGFFIRNDFLNSLDDTQTKLEQEPEPCVEEPLIECEDYELIYAVTYPYFRDNRGKEQKIIDEVTYHVGRFRDDEYFSYKNDRYEIPFKMIANVCWQVTEDVEEIRCAIKNDFVIENDFLILPPNESEPEYESEQDCELMQ